MSRSNSLWLHQFWLFARFEITRLTQTPRGWFALAAFVVVWYFLLRYPIYEAAVQLQQLEIQAMLTQLLGAVGLEQLLRWPLPELSVYWLLCLAVLPLAVLFSAADQTCSDRSRGTLRLLTLRASREVIFLGRFAGQLLTQLLFIAVSLVATLLLACWRLEGLPPLAVLNSVSLIVINLLIVLLPITALMAFCSALAKSSRLAISLAVVLLGAVAGGLGYLVWQFPALEPVLDYLPLAQLPQVLNANDWSMLQHAWLPLLQTVVLLLAGLVVMRRRAL